ncbi:MAG: DUF2169 domain-containing protein [bacterium]
MELRNRTPHLFGQVVDLDRTGAERLIVVLRAEFVIGEGGALDVAPPGDPLRGGDVFYGDPPLTSIAGEAELGATKPATDVLLFGSAVAPRPGTRAMEVRFRVGPIRKAVRVYGERRWKRSLLAKTASDPLPFERVPLIWENAWGGTDTSPDDEKHHGAEPRNPVGRGYRAAHSKLPWEDELCPSLEDPEEGAGGLGRKGVPVGVGPIGRGWEPRRSYAGTYDEKWVAERMPILPDDFDDRFHQAAPPDQIAPKLLTGGEKVELAGLTSESRLEFRLPVLRPRFEVRLRTRVEGQAMVLDTVALHTDTRRLRLLYKGMLRVHGEVPDVRWIECALEESTGG